MSKERVVRVGVLSDTHLDGGSWDLTPFRRLLAGPFAGVDLILHAGDVGDLDWLADVAFEGVRLEAVAGNCDVRDHPQMPPRRVIDLDGYRIGLIHGWNNTADIERQLAEAFAGTHVDAVVFGHTHRPHLATRAGVTYFNPGSMLWPRGAGETVGLLTLTGGSAHWRHIQRQGNW